METKNVSVTKHQSDLIDRLVSSGRYEDASDVVRAGLRLLEEAARLDEQRRALLDRLLDEGIEQLDQGQGIALQTPEELREHIAMLGKQAAEIAGRRRIG